MIMKEKLIEFIEKNSLTFSGYGSDLNSACTIIAGYADFIGVKDAETIIDAIEEQSGDPASIFLDDEMIRVFSFAKTYNYGNWWKEKQAKREYTF